MAKEFSTDDDYVVFMQNPAIGFIVNVPRDSRNKWDWFKCHRSTCEEIGARGAHPERRPWVGPTTYKVFTATLQELREEFEGRRPPLPSKRYEWTDPSLHCKVCDPLAAIS